MHIKRFEAPTLPEALAQVKRELGPDALILSSRTIKRGRHAFGMLSRSVVEVQAAKERGGAAPEKGREPAAPTSSDQRAGFEIKGIDQAALRRESRREEFEEEVRSELRGLRTALTGLMGRESTDPLLATFSAMGLEARHCATLAADWHEQRAAGRAVEVDAFLRSRIEAKLAPPREDEASLVRVVIGAPGVGKTTTLAKLAARNEEGERDVALVSLDHYRIGGADQLRRYAELLDSPFDEMSDAGDVAELVNRHAGRSVLIDTAGRGPGAEEGMTSLLPLRERLGERARVELVLDATARPEVHAAQISRFATLRPDRLILAKADECDSLAPLVNCVLDPRCPPVCWMGTGQRVPEDLELARAENFVSDLVGRAA